MTIYRKFEISRKPTDLFIVSYIALTALWTNCSVFALQSSQDKPQDQTKVELLSLINWWDACVFQNTGVLRESIHLLCVIPSGRVLDIRTLRNDSMRFSYKAVELTITCKYDGRLIFPWPGRIENVIKLDIDGCILLEYNSEYFDTRVHAIQDSVKVFKMTNSIILIDDKFISNAIRTLDEPVIGNAECFPLQSEIVTTKNITYKFDATGQTARSQLEKYVQKFERTNLIKGIRCIYKFLRVFRYNNIHSSDLRFHSLDYIINNSRFPVLQVLNVSNNTIKVIPPLLRYWGLYLEQLSFLDLSYNDISEISVVSEYSSSGTIRKKATIDLRHNNISTITKRALKSFLNHRNITIDIRNNPFLCNCDMNYFVNFINGKNNLTSEIDSPYYYLKELTCAQPKKLFGRRIATLTPEDLGCRRLSIIFDITPAIILSVFISVAIGIFVIIHRFRKEIIIICFTRFHLRLPCQTRRDDQNKIYDAFVAYSEADTAWVLKTLAPRLENPILGRSFKLCLHHRDFTLGAPVAANIVSSVENSRHTILVVSDAFLSSDWCLLEFRTALEQSLMEKKRHLIMILLEDVRKHQIRNDMKRCIKTLTCIKVEERLFWDRLVYSLSDKREAPNIV